MTSTKVLSANNKGDHVEVVVESVTKPGEIQTLTADVMLISTGRRAFTQGLNLEKVGLKADKFGRLDINESF